MGKLDRTKQDWDVMERVFGGVHAEGGMPVPLNTLPGQPQPPEPPRHDRHDRHQEYESDRRGEHKYPHEDDRPSQRERDELKERLERGH